MTNVLIVDDEFNVRSMVNEMLEINGYECTMAANASEARECLNKNSYELILCDINMPGESGLDLIQYSVAQYPETAAVILSGVDDPLIAEEALRIGVYDYIIKPFEMNEILISTANALRRRQLEIDNRAYSGSLEKMVKERTIELQNTVKKLRNALEASINAIALTVEIRDSYTAGHQQRVAALADAIAKEMGLSEDQVDGLHLAGVIHDLGKIGVPAEILSKPGRISEIEFGLIKTHPQVGFNILKGMEFPWPIAKIVLQHHERINGSGYPFGISNDEILLEAKILGVADVVEAMASHRPYRASLGIENALKEISNNRGVLYDSEVVDVCLKLFRKNIFRFEE